MQREKKEAEGPGLVWMSPQSAKIETRRGRWSDVNRERRGIMKKAKEVCLDKSTVVLR